MDLLERIKKYAEERPAQAAVCSTGGQVDFKQLEQWSNRLAAYIDDVCGKERGAVVVYGHKDAWMAVCFLACAKSGRAYCPLDVSLPDQRVEAILNMVKPVMVLEPELEMEPLQTRLSTGGIDLPPRTRIKFAGAREIRDVGSSYFRRIKPENALRAEDTFYVIFTSGSTGEPKGVSITRSCLEHFLDWAVNLGAAEKEREGKVFLNQAPFSFDLSVMDLYSSLACGGTLVTMEKEVQGDYFKLIEFLKKTDVGIWISTPSFAEVCLADPQFTQKQMSSLHLFLFCGETLSVTAAKKLLDRFPQAVVINTYGPTESTVAVSAVRITQELVEQCLQTGEELPVGRVKPGSSIEIAGEDGKAVDPGEVGEIVILGDTVAAGYFGREDLTRQAFFIRNDDGMEIRGYRTGDLGLLCDGMLHFRGRADSQIKLHGYRIEIGDIESNLMRLSGINRAVVIPNRKDGRVKSLTAYVEGEMPEGDERQAVRLLKDQLKKFLPDYMVPKKICFVDKIPANGNGKVDRTALEEIQ